MIKKLVKQVISALVITITLPSLYAQDSNLAEDGNLSKAALFTQDSQLNQDNQLVEALHIKTQNTTENNQSTSEENISTENTAEEYASISESDSKILSTPLRPQITPQDLETPPEPSSREAIYQSAVDFANWVDQFFGEQSLMDSAGYDYLHVISEVYWQEENGFELNPRLKAKIHLPGIDNKFSLLLEDINGKDDYDDKTSQDRLSEFDRERSTSAAINYQSEQYERSRFDSRVGLGSGLKPFAQFKHSFDIYQNETFAIRNFNYLLWKEKYGFGVKSRFEIDKRINDSHLFRWRYSLLHAEKSLGNEWYNQFSWVTQKSPTTLIAYSVSARGFSDYDFLVESYRLALRLRWQSSIKWLYYEIEPEVIWQKTPEFPERKTLAGIYARIEIQLDD